MSSQYLVDEQGFQKKNAIGLTTGVLAVLGTLSALSFGVLSDVKLFGKTIFDLFDYATSNIGMPIGVLGLALVCGWIAWPMTHDDHRARRDRRRYVEGAWTFLNALGETPY